MKDEERGWNGVVRRPEVDGESARGSAVSEDAKEAVPRGFSRALVGNGTYDRPAHHRQGITRPAVVGFMCFIISPMRKSRVCHYSMCNCIPGRLSMQCILYTQSPDRPRTPLYTVNPERTMIIQMSELQNEKPPPTPAYME